MRFIKIPFQQNPEFVGQEQILAQLKLILDDAPSDRQVALYGLGGIGCVAPGSLTATGSSETESHRLHYSMRTASKKPGPIVQSSGSLLATRRALSKTIWRSRKV